MILGGGSRPGQAVGSRLAARRGRRKPSPRAAPQTQGGWYPPSRVSASEARRRGGVVSAKSPIGLSLSFAGGGRLFL